MIVVSAPGKVIVHGEHAVVYGKRALAGSLDLRTTLTLIGRRDGRVVISLPVVSIEEEWTCAELSSLIPMSSSGVSAEPTAATDERLSQLKEFAHLSGDIYDTRQLAIIAFLYLFSSISPEHGAGLGSSAAFSVCLAAGLLAHRGSLSCSSFSPPAPTAPPGAQPTQGPLGGALGDGASEKWGLTEDDRRLINDWAFVAERIIHGRPSGIDNSVSTYGGALIFLSGNITPMLRMPRLRILLTNTKVPRSTKQLVELVRIKYDKYPDIVKPVLESMEAITEHCVLCLEQLASNSAVNDGYATLTDLVDMNQRHLAFLGVSHFRLNQACDVMGRHGLTGKLTGAGGGGCCFAIIPPDVCGETVAETVRELEVAGFDSFETSLGGEGVCIKTQPA